MAAITPPERPKEPPYPLPKPAELVLRDFRPQRPGTDGMHSQNRAIKLVQWNIERGYQMDKIIQQLKELDADILALQEVDIHCERSGWVDSGVEIAKALQLNYAFVCEFEELHSPVREASSQGGGVHGNAVLSKFDISEVRAIEHTTHPIDWESPAHPLAKKEPRKGRRLTAAARVHTPQGDLLVYSAHLECFCGMLARMAQVSDIFRDSREQAARAPGDGRGPVAAQALCGDLNTLGNGVARLSPNYCTDIMRWGSLGWFEAEVWQQRLLSVRSPAASNAWLARFGLPPAVCRDAVNPGFSDPFDMRHDITFDHPKYRYWGWHLMTGKFDWVLLRGCRVLSKAIGNHEYSASDHKWLAVELSVEAEAEASSKQQTSGAAAAAGGGDGGAEDAGDAVDGAAANEEAPAPEATAGPVLRP